MERILQGLLKKYEGHVRYDPLLEAANFVIEELDGDKARAVSWIQENSGGGNGSEYDDIGEVGGAVWGKATYCDHLSTWSEIITTVEHILESR